MLSFTNVIRLIFFFPLLYLHCDKYVLNYNGQAFSEDCVFLRENKLSFFYLYVYDENTRVLVSSGHRNYGKDPRTPTSFSPLNIENRFRYLSNGSALSAAAHPRSRLVCPGRPVFVKGSTTAVAVNVFFLSLFLFSLTLRT